MRYWDIDYGGTGLLLTVALATFVVSAGLLYAGKRTCLAKWDDSVWSFWGGCRVKTERGYIPEDVYIKRYKTIDLNVDERGR